MKKILSLGLAFLLWAALPCRAAAEGEALPEPSPSVSPAVSSPSPEAPGGGTTAADTLPELPLPDFSPSPEPSPPPSEAALSQGPDAPASDSSSIFDFLEGSNATMEVDMIAYYLGEMTAAAAKGDTKAGLEAEKNRNALIDMKGSGEEKISFDDLYLLSKLIYAEAGSDWLDDDFRLRVGEVVLNRVASPEFPDTLYDVIYQKNQYASASSPGFATLVPSQDCVDVALRLLQGERQMVPRWTSRSNYAQGEIFSIHEDLRLGDTFFCVSNNLDLYP